MDRHSSLPALRLLLALVAGLAGGCGGHARQGPEPANVDDGGPPDAADASPDASDNVWVGTVKGVPAGDAFVGGWIFDAAAQRFRRPKGCNDVVGEREANRKLSVARFWLQETPVTNGLYAICFSAGACSAPEHDIADPNPKSWDDPARIELPVYVRHDQAEDYCRWAHGRLPTLAELTRATQGDAEIPGIPALTQAAIDCGSSMPGEAPTAPICEQLQLLNYFQTPPPPLYRTNAFELDRGPYGHADLFGSVWEWTQTWGGFPSDDFCALPDGSPDFVTFDPEHERDQSVVLSFATYLIDAVRSGHARPVRVFPNATAEYIVGFRCAFDSAQ